MTSTNQIRGITNFEKDESLLAYYAPLSILSHIANNLIVCFNDTLRVNLKNHDSINPVVLVRLKSGEQVLITGIPKNDGTIFGRGNYNEESYNGEEIKLDSNFNYETFRSKRRSDLIFRSSFSADGICTESLVTNLASGLALTSILHLCITRYLVRDGKYRTELHGGITIGGLPISFSDDYVSKNFRFTKQETYMSNYYSSIYLPDPLDNKINSVDVTATSKGGQTKELTELADIQRMRCPLNLSEMYDTLRDWMRDLMCECIDINQSIKNVNSSLNCIGDNLDQIKKSSSKIAVCNEAVCKSQGVDVEYDDSENDTTGTHRY